MGENKKMWSIFALTLLIGSCAGDFKRWKFNTNYENPDNWNAGRLPCDKDSVIFPSEAPPVFIQTNSSLMEMVLPATGELILGSFVSLSFASSGQGSDNCVGQDLTYTRTDARSWFSSEAWCTTADIDGNCAASQPDRLHSEAVPCKYDGAAFPPASTFLVNLGADVDIYVSQLKLDSKSYSTGEFSTFLKSEEGQLQFKREAGGHETNIFIQSGYACTDDTGCSCANDVGAIFDKVCGEIECGADTCDNALTPMGHCCHVCGGLLTLDYTPVAFNYDTFSTMIQYNYIQQNPTVKSIISKTSLDKIQVVLMDDGGGDDGARVAQQLAKDLQEDMTGNRKYGITDIKLETSGAQTQPTSSPQTGGGMSSGGVAGLVLGLIILMIIVAFAIYCFMDRKSGRPQRRMNSMKESIRRLTTRPKNNDLELGPSVGFTDTISYNDLLRGGFENPMYGSATPSQIQLQEKPTSMGGAEPGFANPLYGQASAEPQYSGVMDYGSPLDNSAGDDGFQNPLYADPASIPGIQDVPPAYNDSNNASFFRMNPVFSDEDVEEDSSI